MAKKSVPMEAGLAAVEAARPFPRIQKFFTKPTKTRQSETYKTDLSSLVRRYQSVGELPPSRLTYADVSTMPRDRLEAMQLIQDAADAFKELPLKVRQACDHDPRKLENWIVTNPDLAREAGLLAPTDEKSFPREPSPAPSDEGEGNKGEDAP